MNKLWIQTQNKKALINVENVVIIDNKIYANVSHLTTQDEKNKIIRTQQKKYLLGEYNTPEDTANILNAIKFALINPTKIVYDMPEKNPPRSNYVKN